MNQLVT